MSFIKIYQYKNKEWKQMNVICSKCSKSFKFTNKDELDQHDKECVVELKDND